MINQYKLNHRRKTNMNKNLFKRRTAVIILLVCAVSASSDTTTDVPEHDPIESSDPKGRIIGGEKAKAYAHTYLVTIQVYYRGAWRHVCGGSIIDKIKVVTAAHCTADFDVSKGNVRVVAGEYRLSDAGGFEQFSKVKYFARHPLWKKSADYDVAYLEVEEPFVWNGAVRPIPLASTVPPVGTLCWNIGWGNIKGDGGIELPDEPYRVLIAIVDSKTKGCLPGNARQICAGGDGRGSCNLDSGGPLECFRSGEPGNLPGVLVGIVSNGPNPCNAGPPTVFSSVPELKGFLETGKELTLSHELEKLSADFSRGINNSTH